MDTLQKRSTHWTPTTSYQRTTTRAIDSLMRHMQLQQLNEALVCAEYLRAHFTLKPPSPEDLRLFQGYMRRAMERVWPKELINCDDWMVIAADATVPYTMWRRLFREIEKTGLLKVAYGSRLQDETNLIEALSDADGTLEAWCPIEYDLYVPEVFYFALTPYVVLDDKRSRLYFQHSPAIWGLESSSIVEIDDTLLVSGAFLDIAYDWMKPHSLNLTVDLKSQTCRVTVTSARAAL